jgi:cytochrome c
MLNRFLSLCVILAAFAVSTAFVLKKEKATPAVALNTLTAEEKAAGWILLFDGKTTKGWRNYNKQTIGERWKVADGVLYLDVSNKNADGFQVGGGGDIITEAEYENYELRIEWKIAKCGNSGIIYHIHEDAQIRYPWQTGLEYQLIDDTCHPDAKFEKRRASSLYDLVMAVPVVVKPAEEWNKTRLVCKGDQVEHWLNNKKVVSVTMGSPEWKQMLPNSKWKDHPKFGTFRKGNIGLQDHGDGISFRNIKLRKL